MKLIFTSDLLDLVTNKNYNERILMIPEKKINCNTMNWKTIPGRRSKTGKGVIEKVFTQKTTQLVRMEFRIMKVIVLKVLVKVRMKMRKMLTNRNFQTSKTDRLSKTLFGDFE